MRGHWHSRVLLIVLFLVFVALPSIDLERAGSGFVVGLVLDLVLLASIYALSGTRRTLHVGLVLCGITLALSIAAFVTAAPSLWIAVHAGYAVTLGYVAYVMVAELFRARAVDGSTVAAAVSGYLVLGLLWAICYALLVLRNPAGIAGLPVEGQFSALLYFSFTTLTTLGYGDLAPASAGARSLATLEAVAGQLYVAITIARLVGLAVASGPRK